MTINPPSKPSRRLLLVAAVALSASAPATALPDPDHALLADCRELVRIEADLCILLDNCPTLEEEERREAEVNALLKAQGIVVGRIIQHRALTLAGLRARQRHC